MTRTIRFCIPILAAGLSVGAQEDHSSVSMTFGALQKYFDTDSSKFLEYRDVPQGGVVPAFRFEGRKGTFAYDLRGFDVTQSDQRYGLVLRDERFKLVGDYTGIPHNFGNGAKSLLNPVTENDWRISDTIQSSYQNTILAAPGASLTYPFLAALVQSGLDAAPANIDLKLQRNRGRLALSFMPQASAVSVGLTYLHERRSGTRAANGTSFGFGNVVETPEPLRYVTQDVTLQAAYKGAWGSARAGLNFNHFANKFDTFAFDNPFRSTDGTDASAYQSPGSASKNGPVFGLMALPPDNQAVTESAGLTLKLGKRTRLTADVALGQWTQDHDPLLPWTTNTAVRTPSGQLATTAPLPATTLNGKVDVTSLSAFLTTRVASGVGLNARYRRYDRDNKTPRYSLHDGYVRFDAVWEDIPRITVPYGYTNDMLDAYATCSRGLVGLEAGWKHSRMERTFRETKETSENVLRAAADVRASWITLRGMGEFGSRDYDEYDAPLAEDASFLEPGVPANQTVLRRYDQAKRDLTRLGGSVEIAPGAGKITGFASYSHTKFAYDQGPVPCEDVELFPGQAQFCPGGVQAPLGLVDDTYDTFTLEAAWTPGEHASVYAFYSYENGDVLQNGRQSGATLDFNPANVWSANFTNKGHTFGAGADFTIVPQKWTANLVGRRQKIDGNNDVTLAPGFTTAIYGTNALLRECVSSSGPCAVAAFDDTTLTHVSAALRYQFAKQWSAAGGVGYEKYELEDSQTGNTLNYMPASFFLQADNRDYRGWIGFVNLTYSN